MKRSEVERLARRALSHQSPSTQQDVADVLVNRQDNVHYVGGTGEAPFQNSWVNVSASDARLNYWKDSLGICHVQGRIKSGSAAAIFTLPPGYRPTETEYGVCITNSGGADALARVDVATTGIVTSSSTATSYLIVRLSFKIGG
jgi:hypothetical protein